jgi:tetratricopeptide (TPR) repeat protein
LAGYRSSTLLLAGRKPMDNPDIGTIVLYPIVKTEGQAISATSANAPKDARKAADKGLDLLVKKKYDQAAKEFEKAVALHPKYAEAWLGLGKAYVGLSKPQEAHDALLKATEADSRFVYPYEQLYKISFEQGNWQDLLTYADKLLRLNPYDFPEAYYYTGVAQYQLKNTDAAIKSLQQAMEFDKGHKNPKIHYVMGLVLVQKRDLRAAADELAAFVNLAPNDAQVPKARGIIEQITKLSESPAAP